MKGGIEEEGKKESVQGADWELSNKRSNLYIVENLKAMLEMRIVTIQEYIYFEPWAWM